WRTAVLAAIMAIERIDFGGPLLTRASLPAYRCRIDGGIPVGHRQDVQRVHPTEASGRKPANARNVDNSSGATDAHRAHPVPAAASARSHSAARRKGTVSQPA